MGKDTEALKGEATFPRLHSQELAKAGLDSGNPTSLPSFLTAGQCGRPSCPVGSQSLQGDFKVELGLPSLASRGHQARAPGSLLQAASQGKGAAQAWPGPWLLESMQSTRAGGLFPWRQKGLQVTLKCTCREPGARCQTVPGGRNLSLDSHHFPLCHQHILRSSPQDPQQDTSSRNKTSQPTSRSATPRGASLVENNSRGQQAWHSCGCQPAEHCPA